MRTLITTLCLIQQDGKVLLGMKKRGFAVGKWNGFGGKVEAETLEDNVRREAREECGIELKNIEKIGIIDFEFVGNPEVIQVHYFKVNEFTGSPIETEEMKPKWFSVKEIPFKDMWPDDEYWFPFFLEGKKFKGMFHYDKNEVILKKELKEVDII